MLTLAIKHCGCHNGLHLEKIFLFNGFTAQQLLKKLMIKKKESQPPKKQAKKSLPKIPQHKQAKNQKEAVNN